MPNSALRIIYLLPLSLRYFWLGANTTPYKYKDWNRVFRQRPTGRTSTKLDAGPQPAEVRNSGPPPPEAAARAAPRAAIFGRNTRRLRTPAKTCAGSPACPLLCGPRYSPNRNRRAQHTAPPDTREDLPLPATSLATRTTPRAATAGRDTRLCRTPAKTCPGSPACPLLCGPRSSPNRNRRAQHTAPPDTREDLPRLSGLPPSLRPAQLPEPQDAAETE